MILISNVFLNESAPSLFQYNQSTFQAFYFFENIYIDTNLVSNKDWIGTFNCQKWNIDSTDCIKIGKCVGTRKYDRDLCGSGICDLPAMGEGSDGKDNTLGYLKPGEYPVFLIYDQSSGLYYKTLPNGDVDINREKCRNGYPFCYGWKNQSFTFSKELVGTEIYMDCLGKLKGTKMLDECGICGGAGPQFKCEQTGKSYCNEAKYLIDCSVK